MSDDKPVDPAISAVMREMGRKGGLKNAGSFLKEKSPEERSEFARKASAARWGKKRKASKPSKPRKK